MKEYKNIKDQFAKVEVKKYRKDRIEETGQYEKEKLEETKEISFQYDWDSMKSMNPEIEGWLFLPDSEISYPVVKGVDNSFYLNHSFEKKKNRNGCLFFDYQTDNNHNNKVIYGHNMGIGKTVMFSTLIKWERREWFNEHSMIYYTPINEKTRIYNIFAIIKTSVKEIDDLDYRIQIFSNEKKFMNWIRQLKKNSVIETDIIPKYGDKILTLSTCDRREYASNGRFVVLAVKRTDVAK